MPDITMCNGGDCPRKKDCYRHVATPSRFQSYFAKPPFSAEDGCDYYTPVDRAPEGAPPTSRGRWEGEF